MGSGADPSGDAGTNAAPRWIELLALSGVTFTRSAGRGAELCGAGGAAAGWGASAVGGGGGTAREGEVGGIGAGLEGTGGRADGGVAGVEGASGAGVAGTGCCLAFCSWLCLAKRS